MADQFAFTAVPSVVGPSLCVTQANSICSRSVIAGTPLTFAQPTPAAVMPGITMKKSRFHAPLRKPKPEEQKLPEDGTPVFGIFVRTNRAKIWYPLGSVKGDDRSKMLVGALKNAIGRALYANALDKGIAQTIYGQGRRRFTESAIRMYPQLKRYQKELEFGYKVAAIDLEPQKIKAVTPDQALSAFETMKRKISNVLNQQK